MESVDVAACAQQQGYYNACFDDATPKGSVNGASGVRRQIAAPCTLEVNR